MSGEIEIYDQGYNLISTGTIINNATLDAWETMYVSSGGSASNIEVGKGSMIVYGSGSATGITINEWGACTVSGGEVHNVIVNPGGTFSFLAGSATAVVENGGHVDFADHADITILPNTISGIVFDWPNPESKGISSYSVDGRKFPHLRNGGGTVICYGNLHHRSFECGLFGNQLSCL